MCLFFETVLELMREPVSAAETALKSACANFGKKSVCMPAVSKIYSRSFEHLSPFRNLGDYVFLSDGVVLVELDVKKAYI